MATCWYEMHWVFLTCLSQHTACIVQIECCGDSVDRWAKPNWPESLFTSIASKTWLISTIIHFHCLQNLADLHHYSLLLLFINAQARTLLISRKIPIPMIQYCCLSLKAKQLFHSAGLKVYYNLKRAGPNEPAVDASSMTRCQAIIQFCTNPS